MQQPSVCRTYSGGVTTLGHVSEHPGALKEDEDDLQCPICVQPLQDAFVTTCGHTFCFQCISTHLKHRKNCPSCSSYLTKEHIYPNFLLNKIISKRITAPTVVQGKSFGQVVEEVLQSIKRPVQPRELDSAIQLLQDHQNRLLAQEENSGLHLLLMLLQDARQRNVAAISSLEHQLSVLESDIQAASKQVSASVQQGHTGPPHGSSRGACVVMSQTPLAHDALQRHLSAAAATAMQNGGSLHVHRLNRDQLASICIPAGQLQNLNTSALAQAVHGQHTQLEYQQQQQAVDGSKVGGMDVDEVAAEQEGTMLTRQHDLQGHLVSGIGRVNGQSLQTYQDGGSGPPMSNPIPQQQQQQQQRHNTSPATNHTQQATQKADLNHSQGAGAAATAQISMRFPARLRAATTRQRQSREDMEDSDPGTPTSENVRNRQQQQPCKAHLDADQQQYAHVPFGMAVQVDMAGAGMQAQQQQAQGNVVMARHGGHGSQVAHTVPGYHTSVLGMRTAANASLADAQTLAAARAAKRRLLLSQYQGLERCYLSLHGADGSTAQHVTQHGDAMLMDVADEMPRAPAKPGLGLLQEFSQVLSAVTTFSKVTVLAEIPRAASGGPNGCNNTGGANGATNASRVSVGRPSSSSLVSSIDCNLSGSTFAACSAQRLFLWDYNTVTGSLAEQQSAAAQLHSRTKLTGVAFSKENQNSLAACDSEGLICLYDVSTLQLVLDIEAHDSRIWALDFAPSCADQVSAGSHSGPFSGSCFASGSDDYTVRIWDSREDRPISTIDTRANVCSVKFSSWDNYYLAVGSAAHAVMVYDLRKAGGTTAPLASLQGHTKAVSYVRWSSRNEVISASTDSTLRLWNVDECVSGEHAGLNWHGSSGSCVRKYTGHTNERNFVGLAVEGDLIAAGSETHEVVVYHKPISTPCVRHVLGGVGVNSSSWTNNAQQFTRPPRSQYFVSSLCWHAKDQSLLAASSQGSVWVLSLQQ